MTKLLITALFCIALTACSGAPAPQTSSPAPPASPSTAAPTAPTDRSNLEGVWSLVSFEQNEADGSVSTPYSDMPIGRLTFDHAGRMSVIVMKPGRVASVNSTAAIATAQADDLRQIADGFLAYYGSFEVDEPTKTITTKVEACTIPAWTNAEQKRTYDLSVDTLTLLTPATKLMWKRLPD